MPSYAKYCPHCGVCQNDATTPRRAKQRANGEGCAYLISTNNWICKVSVRGPDGKRRFKTKSGFHSKSEALQYVPILKKEPLKETVKTITLKEAYDKMMSAKSVSSSTVRCYNCGIEVFKDLYFVEMANLSIDDLQAELDECAKGKRTYQLAKTALGLVYKWAIPRGFVPEKLNFAEYLKINIGDTRKIKHSFTNEQLDIIKSNIGTVDFADFIYCQCYLGYRPTELLSLRRQDYIDGRYFVGGIKTEAGKDRIVTISPKIKSIIDERVLNLLPEQYIFGTNGNNMAYKTYNAKFYKALSIMGIQEEKDHQITPHCCRHTFATLIKSIDAPDKDKLELMGHTDPKMLMYYQDTDIDSLEKITNLL